jgi:hypothetical protein
MDYDPRISDYNLCNANLQQRVIDFAQEANIPNELVRRMISAGRRILCSKKAKLRCEKISPEDLLDSIQSIYSKANSHFIPVLRNLVDGAISADAEGIRTWYSAAKQAIIFYSSALSEKEKTRLEELFHDGTDPDKFRDEIALLQNMRHNSYEGPIRVGRMSGVARQPNRGWNLGKAKQV